MGLPTCQQRTLDSIEGELSKSDPPLASLFAIFARLTRSEAMPLLEQLKVRPPLNLLAWLPHWCRRLARRPAARVRALILLPAALTATACALTLAFGLSGSQRHTPGATTPVTRQLVVKHGLCRLALARVPILAC
jgi:hypothetical protein